jgi:hypothetical protein
MIELILLSYLLFRNYLLAKSKDQKPVKWVLLTVLAYVMSSTFGAMIILSYFSGNAVDINKLVNMDLKARENIIETVIYLNPLHLVTYILSGIGGYLLIRYILERKPDKKKPEVHWMDKLGDN